MLSDILYKKCLLTFSTFITDSDNIKRRRYTFALFGGGGNISVSLDFFVTGYKYIYI